MLPELGRLINAFYSSPFFPLSTGRPRIAYGSSSLHDANDPASACGIDALHKFPVFPPATPTRTSLVSFEPLLPLLTYLCLSPFILLPMTSPLPRGALASSGRFCTVVLGRQLLGLLSRWGGIQLVDSADDHYCRSFREKRLCGSHVVLEIGFLTRSRRRLNLWGGI